MAQIFSGTRSFSSILSEFDFCYGLNSKGESPKCWICQFWLFNEISVFLRIFHGQESLIILWSLYLTLEDLRKYRQFPIKMKSHWLSLARRKIFPLVWFQDFFFQLKAIDHQSLIFLSSKWKKSSHWKTSSNLKPFVEKLKKTEKNLVRKSIWTEKKCLSRWTKVSFEIELSFQEDDPLNDIFLNEITLEILRN